MKKKKERDLCPGDWHQREWQERTTVIGEIFGEGFGKSEN